MTRVWLHLLLLVATLLTTTGTFFVVFRDGLSGASLPGLFDAAQFGLTLVLILGAHEMGHYLLARFHRVDTSLPYFIPAPLLGVGTLGAVIRIRGRIPDRNALVDIGAAGPIAGLVVAVPVLLYGLAHSEVSFVPINRPDAFLGPGSLWALLSKLFGFFLYDAGAPSGAGTSFWLFGDNLLMLLLQWLVKGPLPPGHDVVAHPMVISGWFGLLVTMLNLVPIGQLDGGHLTHAIFGRRAELLGKLAAIGMLALCLFFSLGWAFWLLITTQLVGFRHPEVLSPEAPLSRGRRLLCIVSLAALVLCLMPVPLTPVTWSSGRP